MTKENGTWTATKEEVLLYRKVIIHRESQSDMLFNYRIAPGQGEGA